MATEAKATHWRGEYARLCSQMEEQLAPAIEDAIRARCRTTAEGLNQTVRRIRKAAAPAEALSILVDDSAALGERMAVFTVNETSAQLVHAHGIAAAPSSIPLKEAAAFYTAIETKDPVTAMGSEREISAPLFESAMAGLPPGEKVHVFPIVAREAVVALLFSVGNVEAVQLELLCECCGMSFQPAPPAAAVPSQLVQLTRPSTQWSELTPQLQALHLRAQRVARVKVAEMRVSRQAAVREGIQTGNLYGALQPEIDAARELFRAEFLAASPTMVDYLFLELVRSLANDDEKMLGPDFPGPLR